MTKFSTHSNIKSQYIIIVSKTNMGINGSGRTLTDKQVICYAFDGKLMSYSNLENILFYSIISDGVKRKISYLTKCVKTLSTLWGSIESLVCLRICNNQAILRPKTCII